MASVAFFEVTTAIAVGVAVGWAVWSTVTPMVASWRQRRIERRVWGAKRRQLQHEQLGLGPYRDEPTYLRDQRTRDRGRR